MTDSNHSPTSTDSSAVLFEDTHSERKSEKQDSTEDNFLANGFQDEKLMGNHYYSHEIFSTFISARLVELGFMPVKEYLLQKE